MKFLFCLLTVMLAGCAGNIDGKLYEAHYQDDAQVELSAVVQAVRPVSMPDGALKALILPFSLRQDIAARASVGREMTDIFRLAWLEKGVFDVLEYDSDETWPGLAKALAQGRAKGANLLVSGNVSQFFESGPSGRTAISVTVEIHWVPDGTLLWSAAQAAAMEGGLDKDFVIVRTSKRLPSDPTYAVMRALSVSLADAFGQHLEDRLPAPAEQ